MNDTNKIFTNIVIFKMVWYILSVFHSMSFFAHEG